MASAINWVGVGIASLVTISSAAYAWCNGIVGNHPHAPTHEHFVHALLDYWANLNAQMGRVCLLPPEQSAPLTLTAISLLIS
jgi:hypothetical protein